MRMFMTEAGSAVPSANRITLLRDADGDGVAETAIALSSPTSFAVRHGPGRRHALRRQCRRAGALSLPHRRRHHRRGAAHGDRAAGGRNHHWTKSLVASPTAAALCRRRLEQQRRRERPRRGSGDGRRSGRSIPPPARTGSSPRAAQSGRPRLEPGHGDLYVVVNERDELGSDLVPDYLTSVREGGFYGWP